MSSSNFSASQIGASPVLQASAVLSGVPGLRLQRAQLCVSQTWAAHFCRQAAHLSMRPGLMCTWPQYLLPATREAQLSAPWHESSHIACSSTALVYTASFLLAASQDSPSLG